MLTRIYKNPAFTQIGALAGVGTFDYKNWFICVLESHGEDGKSYKGYYAFWRFDRNFDSKEKATIACKNWLGMSLI